jgi:large repetitive protein
MAAHTPDQVKAFDRLKVIVLLILVALLLLLLCNVLRPPAAMAPTPTVALPTAPPITPPQPPTPMAALVAPTLRAEAKDGKLALNGTGTPGSTVQIVLDGKVIGTAPVGADGKWSFSVDVSPGEHEIIANALDAGGKVAAAAPPLKLSIAAPLVAPTLDKLTSTVGPLNLTGTGTPGSTVQVVVDGKVVGTAPVGADGKWSFKLDVAPGAREIVANALDAAGKVVAAAPPFKLVSAAPSVLPPAGASGLGRVMAGLGLLMVGCALVMKGYAASTKRPGS